MALILTILYHFILYIIQDLKNIRESNKFQDLEEVSLKDLNYTPLVNIIVPAWREDKIFQKCLSSLEKLTYPRIKVIVNAGGNEKTLRIKKD